MEIFTVLALLVYWAIIILAPVLAKDNKKFNENILLQLENPSK